MKLLNNTLSGFELIKQLEENETKKIQKCEAPMRWVQDFISLYGVNNCLFVTLASNKDHSIYYIQKAINDWLNNICFRIFRSSRDKLTEGSINFLAFLESNEKQYYHYHLIIYINPKYKDYFKRLCDGFWKKRVYDGTTDIQDISDPIGLSKYVTKEYYKTENQEYFYCF